MSNAWDRMEGEPTLWFERFERYRMMGPTRTMLGTVNAEKADTRGSKRNSRSPGAWDDAAEKWRWKERAQAWDDAQRAKTREVEANSIEERRKAWINQALAIQAVGAQALLKLQDKLQEDGLDNPMSARDVLAFLEGGLKLELLARGEATEISKHEHSGTVTVEQRRTRLLGLVDSIRERVGTGRN